MRSLEEVKAFFTQDINHIPEFYKNMANQMDEAVYSLTEGGKLLGAGTTIVSVYIR